jgi:histidinol-phosphatase (PHP family)
MKKDNWDQQLLDLYPAETNWYPSDEILELANFYGVDVTFGSDSHVPERVADEFEIVRERLRAIGYSKWAVFRQKQKILIPL